MKARRIRRARRIMQMREWANTKKGERIIVQTLTSMTALTIILGILIFVGYAEL